MESEAPEFNLAAEIRPVRPHVPLPRATVYRQLLQRRLPQVLLVVAGAAFEEDAGGVPEAVVPAPAATGRRELVRHGAAATTRKEYSIGEARGTEYK